MTHAEGRWTACPPGELNRLAARLRGRRRRRHATRAATVVAVLLGGLGVWALQAGPREYHYAGIGCSQVQDLAMAFARGDLEPELANRVESHVDQCPHCHDRFEEMGLLSALVLPDLSRLTLGWLAFLGPPHHRETDASTHLDESHDLGFTAGSAG